MPWQKKDDGIERILPTIKHESDRHRKAFETYWDMGISRSYRMVAEKESVSIPTIANWARSFKWQDRLQERERVIAQRVAADVIVQESDIRRKGLVVLEDWENKLLSIAEKMLSEEMLDRWLNDPKKSLNPEYFEKIARIVMDIKQPKELKHSNATLPTIINIIPKSDSQPRLPQSNDGRGEVIEGEVTEIRGGAGNPEPSA